MLYTYCLCVVSECLLNQILGQDCPQEKVSWTLVAADLLFLSSGQSYFLLTYTSLMNG